LFLILGVAGDATASVLPSVAASAWAARQRAPRSPGAGLARDLRLRHRELGRLREHEHNCFDPRTILYGFNTKAILVVLGPVVGSFLVGLIVAWVVRGFVRVKPNG
jgi:hypothetical protein